MFKHVLLPTDGSPVAAKAVKAGVALAKELGAKITGYYAVELPQTPRAYYGDSYIVDRRIVAELERRAREVGQLQLDRIRKAADAAGVAYTPLITKAGSAHAGIIAAAKKQKCDVIFMASHGRGSVSSLVMGSVTQKVLAHSKIPVLVYR